MATQMTDAEIDALRAAQVRVVAAERELADALTARNDLFRKYRTRGIGVTAMARVVPMPENPSGHMDRTVVARIVGATTPH